MSSKVTKIQIKRGLEANLPTLSAGEPAFTTDQKNFYVGDGTLNQRYLKTTGDTMTGPLVITPTADSTTAIQINKADGSTNVLNVDTTNARVGIGTTSPEELFDVTGTLGSVQITYHGNYLLFTRDSTNYISATGASAALSLGAGGNATDLQILSNHDVHINNGNLVLNSNWLSGDGGDEGLAVDSSGNVGIGTTGPSTILHVKATNPEYRLESTNASNYRVGFRLKAANGSDWMFGTSYTNDTTNSFFISYWGSNAFLIAPTLNIGIGTRAPLSKLGILGNLSVGGTYGAVAAPAGGMIIEGNVGIGTTGPEAPLHIAGTSSAELRVESTSANSTSYLRLKNDARSWALQVRGDTSDSFIIRDLNAGSPNERLVIDTSGNVGIGTTGPDVKLEVFGSTGLKISFDATDNTTLVTDTNGDLTITPSGTKTILASGLTLSGAVVATPDAITATGEGVAASIVTVNTEVTTNDDNDLDNVTLANGTSGQIKHIYCVASFAGDTWKITPATLLGGTQITFGDNSVGTGCTLTYADNEGWIIIGNNGGTIA